MKVKPSAPSSIPSNRSQDRLRPRQSPDMSGWYILLLQGIDIGIMVASLQFAVGLREVLPFGPRLTDLGWPSWKVFFIAPLLGIAVFAVIGVYRADQVARFRRELVTLLRAGTTNIVLLAGVLYFVERDVSRWLFIYYGLVSMGLAITIRLAVRGTLAALGFPLLRRRRVLVVGAGPVGLEVSRRLSSLYGPRYEVVGYVDDEGERSEASDGLPMLGSLEEVASIVRRLAVEVILIAVPKSAWETISKLMRTVHDLPIEVKVIPDYFDAAYLQALSDEVAGMPAIGLKTPVLTPWERSVKRSFDLAVGSVLLLLAMPLLFMSGIAIGATSSGPILYRQRRIGEGGRAFWMYKLRTMVPDADQRELYLVQGHGERLCFAKGPDDPRVTRVGAFLRQWSIDELPQLWNVIMGDLSLVGPRPELPSLLERYNLWQRKRFGVPQGVTGWWQVNGRPQAVNDKVEMDLYYARHYSVRLDLRILLKTIPAVIRRYGAC